jgi:hypothetical protein
MCKKLNSKKFDIDTYIDNNNNLYQINKFSKYINIGTFHKNIYNHIFNIIEPMPIRTKCLPPYILNEEMKINEWSSKYGYSYDEYQKYKSIN